MGGLRSGVSGRHRTDGGRVGVDRRRRIISDEHRQSEAVIGRRISQASLGAAAAAAAAAAPTARWRARAPRPGQRRRRRRKHWRMSSIDTAKSDGKVREYGDREDKGGKLTTAGEYRTLKRRGYQHRQSAEQLQHKRYSSGSLFLF